jgi:hypothetical protein
MPEQSVIGLVSAHGEMPYAGNGTLRVHPHFGTRIWAGTLPQ